MKTTDNTILITVGQAQGLRAGAPQEAEQIFQRMNGNW